MESLRFVWDPQKAKSNKLKHRVTFAEAETVFFDDDAIEFADPDHSQAEDRFYNPRHEYCPEGAGGLLLLPGKCIHPSNHIGA